MSSSEITMLDDEIGCAVGVTPDSMVSVLVNV